MEEFPYAGLILARGGSVGIPRKNSRPLGGVPLVQRAVRTLRACHALSWVGVSTDDDVIAGLASDAGAQVIERPPALATSEAPAIAAVEHAARELLVAGIRPRAILLFQATSPLVTSADVDQACALFDSTDAIYGKSVTEVRERPEWMAQVVDGKLQYCAPASVREQPRQRLPQWVRLNGAISIFRTEAVLDGDPMAGQPLAIQLPADRSVDLDDEWDWCLAEWLLERAQQPS